MKYYVINHERKTITEFRNERQASIHCNIALKFSNTLCIFYYSELQFNKLDIDKSKFEMNF